MTDIYGWPYFNPEVVEAECYPVEFPVEHDIEYVGGIRVHRVTEFKNGHTRLLWACEHGQSDSTPEGAAANCVQDCEEKTMLLTSETWELRNQVRVQTLRELATIVRSGVPLTVEALEEMAHECERARASVDLLSLTIEPEE